MYQCPPESTRRSVSIRQTIRRIAILTLLCAPFFAGITNAQPVRNRILQGLDVHDGPESQRVQVHFANPIRYLRHTPRGRGRELQVQLQHLDLALSEIVPALLRETLKPPRDEDLPLERVVYDGGEGGAPVLEIRFTRIVDFEVRQGDDLRSIAIVIRREGRSGRARPEKLPELPRMPDAPRMDLPPIRIEHRFAIELETVLPGETPTAPPRHELFERYRLYRIPVQSGEEVSYRYRLGFLPSRKAAKQAQAELAASYPDCAVVPTSRAERATSAQRGVSVAGLRDATLLALPPAQPRADAPEPPAQPRADASEPPTRPRTDAPEPPARTDSAEAGLLARGRDAMTGEDHALAIRLFTAILASPEAEQGAEAREAQELLGLARERRGQLAHAKAEYETYLARYPEGEGTERVRQRLDAMLTRSAPQKEKLRPARAEGPEWELQTFGSLYTSYYRSDTVVEALDDLLSDSVAFTDLNVSARLRKGDYDIRTRASGSYRYDIPFDSAVDQFRLSSLFVEASDRGRGLEGALGRQSANSGGVLGRFDGLRLSVSVLDGWRLGSVAGLPVGISREPRLDTDRYFTGVSIDTPRFMESIEGQIWAIGQQADGLLDRAAVGTEVRYIDPSLFVAGFLDIDVSFGELNTAMLIGNWSYSQDTSFNWTLDHRLSPILTLENALIGQTAETLRELRDTYSAEELAELAADRTAHSTLGTLGATHHLTENLQLSGDATLTHLSGTRTSGGVEGTDGTGLEYALGLQLLMNGAFMPGDVSTATFRSFLGDITNSYTLQLRSRLPIGDDLRIQPLLLLGYDDRLTGGSEFAIEPGVRADFRVWRLSFDAELVFEYATQSGGVDPGDEYGYRAQLGIRYDFE